MGQNVQQITIKKNSEEATCYLRLYFMIKIFQQKEGRKPHE